MAFEANNTPFDAAVQLLVETDRVQCSKSLCRPPRPIVRQPSDDSSRTDSGFYSCSSDNNSSANLPLQSCLVSQEMILLSKNLLLLYCDKKISAGDASVDVRSKFGEIQHNCAVDAFLTSTGITSTNAWNTGGQIASHVLKSLPKHKTHSPCESEVDLEIYLSLVLSITSPMHDSSMYLKRATKLCKNCKGEVSEYVHLVQTSSHFNSLAFPASPTSSTPDQQRFIPNRLRGRNGKSIGSVSSIPPRLSLSSILSSKAQPITATVIEESGALGSFTVTAPARNTLRSVISQSSHRRGSARPPLPWSLEIPLPGKDLPTISRTPSVTDTASSSEGPQTPDLVQSPTAYEDDKKPMMRVMRPFVHERAHTLPVLHSRSPTRPIGIKINPILAKVEGASKFRTKTECATCHKAGLDFPKCPRCEQMWCSRECRLQGGKRHVCARV